MKISREKNQNVTIREVYNDVDLVAANGEKFTINMRDSGFEFIYHGKKYFAKDGVVGPASEDGKKS